MTVRLSPLSERRIAATRFGAELAKAMTARSVGKVRLARAAKVTSASVSSWRQGNNLPRIDTAARLADALNWPTLLQLATDGRSGECESCGRRFFNEGGTNKRFCNQDCQYVAAQLRRPGPGTDLAKTVKAALARGGTVRRVELQAAIAVYDRSDARRVQRIDKTAQRLSTVQAAVDAMCRSCEPEGICRDVACALRPVSPLPLPLDGDRGAEAIGPAGGVWSEQNREKTLAAVRKAAEKRWARDGERERASVGMRAWYAAMTPEERAQHNRRISDGRKKGRAA